MTRSSPVLAFLDTEFTDLVIRHRLLSVGRVTPMGDGREFYAEVTDPDRLRATSRFGQDAVLPLFSNIGGSACSYAAVGARLSAFLAGLAADLEAGEFVNLAHAAAMQAAADPGDVTAASEREAQRIAAA